jgi:hypothetical protein
MKKYTEQVRTLLVAIGLLAVFHAAYGFTFEERRDWNRNEKKVLNQIWNAYDWRQDTTATSTTMDSVTLDGGGAYDLAVQNISSDTLDVWFKDADTTRAGGPVILTPGQSYQVQGVLISGFVYDLRANTGILAWQAKFTRDADAAN